MTAAVGLLFFAIVVAILALVKPRPIQSRKIQLLRAFFPSWKFFDRPGEMPVLYFRFLLKGPWTPALEDAKRAWYTPLYNPHGNFLFACQSLLLQTVSDLEELTQAGGDTATLFETSTSYQLVKNLAEFQIRKMHLRETPSLSASSSEYQFKIVSVSAAAPQQNNSEEDLLISAVHEVHLS